MGAIHPQCSLVDIVNSSLAPVRMTAADFQRACAADGPAAWTWLPLTAHQASIFLWDRWLNDPVFAATHARLDSAAVGPLLSDQMEKLIWVRRMGSCCTYPMVSSPQAAGERIVRAEFRIYPQWYHDALQFPATSPTVPSCWRMNMRMFASRKNPRPDDLSSL